MGTGNEGTLTISKPAKNHQERHVNYVGERAGKSPADESINTNVVVQTESLVNILIDGHIALK